MLTTSLITRRGLGLVLNDLIEYANQPGGNHTYQPSFSTLDGRIRFYIMLSPAFGCGSADKLVRMYLCRSCSSMQDEENPDIRIAINCRRWEFSIGFDTEIDSETDEPEEDIPEYAKQYRKLINPHDDCGSLLSMCISDHPTEKDIDRILQSMRKIQLMKACGCGNPVSPISLSLSPDADLCTACQLTIPDDPEDCLPEDSCPICLEDVIPQHASVMECCGMILHRGCRQEVERHRDNCFHCQQSL